MGDSGKRVKRLTQDIEGSASSFALSEARLLWYHTGRFRRFAL